MKPTGWFQIGWSTDVGVGDVVPRRCFGEDLVLYRGTDGVVRVHDAYCQHLGANLAYGGCVTDAGIQCPFHGWVWAPDGSNVSIPYQDRPNTARTVRAWPVVERNESLYVWHDAAGRPPAWEVPDALRVFGDYVSERQYRPVAQSHFTGLQVHPQVVAENAVDPHHFRFVHGTPVSPVVLEERVAGPEWFALVGFGRRWANHEGPVTDRMNTIAILWSGLGTSFNAELTASGIRVISINVLPVDADTTEIFAAYWLDRGAPGDGPEADDDARYRQRLDEAMRALPDDINIWDHQRYLDRPGLATSEAAGFTTLRRWAQSFYPAAVAS